MYMFVRMTIRIIVVWVFVMYISVRLSIHILIGFVMYMFVQMTIHFFLMGFRHVQFVLMTIHNFEWNVVIYISVRMTTFSFWMDFLHVHFCTDDYLPILNGFLSWTFLYGWLPSPFEWISVMYISARITTISFWVDCRHLHFCTDDYNLILKGLLSFTFVY